MCKPWVKLNTDILYNRTMKKMKDNEQLAYIKLIVLAGREGEDGHLPNLEDCAIELSTTEKKLSKILERLKELGVITERNEVMFVTNFVERQGGTLTDAEKQKAYRERKKSESESKSQKSVTQNVTNESNASVTNVTLDKDIDIDIDKDIDIEKEKYIKRKKALPNKVTQKVTPLPKHKFGEYKNVLLSDEELETLKKEFPDDWEKRIENVSQYCASHGKTYKNYLATIRTWAKKDEGKPEAPRKKTNAELLDEIEEEERLGIAHESPYAKFLDDF